jgi:hypothetical protein
MSKNPYPIHFRDYEKKTSDSQKAIDENNDHSHGGPGSLPSQQYDAADDFPDGAKGWSGTDRSVFE